MMLSQQSYPRVRPLSFLSLCRSSHSTFMAVWAQVILLRHMRAESWMPGALGRVGAAFGWGWGGRVSACALIQGKVGRSSFLWRIKLIILLVLFTSQCKLQKYWGFPVAWSHPGSQKRFSCRSGCSAFRFGSGWYGVVSGSASPGPGLPFALAHRNPICPFLCPA